MNPTARRISLWGLSLFLCGCVSSPDYPKHWAAFPKHDSFAKVGDKCDIAGTYADAGEAPQGQDGYAAVSLFHILFPQLSSAVTADRVTLGEMSSGALEVLVWQDNHLLETRRLQNHACLENGSVMVNPGVRSSGGGCVATVCAGNQDDFLYRGGDGWLVLKRVDLVVVLPWFKWQTRWYRFRPEHPEGDIR